MQLTINAVLRIFDKYYGKIFTKKDLTKYLISVIDPNYKRISDSSFEGELYSAHRNIKNELAEIARSISQYDSQNNLKKYFKRNLTKSLINKRIQLVINKLIYLDNTITDDTELMESINGVPTPITFQQIQKLDFFEFMRYILIYTIGYTKFPIDSPISHDEINELEHSCIKDNPIAFLEGKKQGKIYVEYYQKACENISKIKTILYRNQAVDFYDIYIATDIKSYDEKTKTLRSLRNLKINTKNFINTFGQYTTIIAPGGFGKSMFLKHLFLCDSIPNLEEKDVSNVVPILIEVRSFSQNNNDLETMLYNNISNYVSIPLQQFKSDLSNGNFLILFDGLDELKLEESEAFFDQLNNLTIKYSNNYYVTSSRPSERCECLKKFISADLTGFAQARAIKMIKKLPDIPQEEKDKFCDELENGEFKRNIDIASNPLLLTLMFMIFREYGKLPEKRYQFYENAYKIMYNEHDNLKNYRSRNYQTRLNRIALSKLISKFCYNTYLDEAYEFTEDYIVDILEQIEPDVDPDAFIHDLVNNLNLIYLENGKYHFIHRSFQEYFAAKYCTTNKSINFADLIKWINLSRKKKETSYLVYYISNKGQGLYDFMKDMNYELVHKKIILPYLKPVIESKNDEIGDFLNYLILLFTNINIGYEVCCSCELNLLNIIVNEFVDNREIETTIVLDYEEYLPLIKDLNSFRSEPYWLMDTENERNEKLSKEQIEDYLNSVPQNYKKAILDQYESVEPRYDFSIPVNELINNREKYQFLITKLYFNQKFKDLYLKLKSIYSLEN